MAFTLCVKNRHLLFLDDLIVGQFTTTLIESAKKYLCEVPIYLFMPDHCHLLLEGISERSNVSSAMKAFKQKTGYWMSNHFPTAEWQKGYYDHILRGDEDILRQIKYVLDNPVRKSLVDDWQKYKYKGSTIYNLNEM